MANRRDRSYYDLALNTNTHQRIQTALQTGNLISSLASLHQTRKARLEAQEHHDDAMRGLDTLAQVVQKNSQQAIAAANRNADLASRQRYSQWVGTTVEGERLHNVYIPLATKQITAVDVTLRMWREEILRRVAEAVGGLSSQDYGLITRTSTPIVANYIPKPAPPAPQQITSIRGFRSLLIVIAALLIGGFLGSLLGYSSAQSTTLTDQGYTFADSEELAEIAQRDPETAARMSEAIEIVLGEPIGTVLFGSDFVAGFPRESVISSMFVKTARDNMYSYRDNVGIQASVASNNILVTRITAGGMIGSFGLPVLTVGVLYLRRRKRKKNLDIDNQLQIEQWQHDCDDNHRSNTRIHKQYLADTERARDEVVAQLESELGFNVDSSEVMDTLFVQQSDVLAHRDRIDSFIRTAYLENPLQSTWVPLMAAPRVSANWADTPLEDFARKLDNTLLNATAWENPPASPQAAMK